MFTAVHDSPQDGYGGRMPDCTHVDLLEELSEAVYQQRAHLGIAFDGDADRVALVDGDGTALTAEETTWILLHSFLDEMRGEPFVCDLKFSDQIAATACRFGASPVVQRSGHSVLRSKMLDAGALFGADVGGHYFYGELQGGEDGIYTACRIIDYLARDGRSLAELRRQCPTVYMTPDLHIALSSDQPSDVIARIRDKWSDYPQRAQDGVRIDFPDGWAFAQSHPAERALTVRFESSSWTNLYRLVWRFCDALDDVGDTLWAGYEAAMGSQCPLD
jgi:phosphomannomutase